MNPVTGPYEPNELRLAETYLQNPKLRKFPKVEANHPFASSQKSQEGIGCSGLNTPLFPEQPNIYLFQEICRESGIDYAHIE